MQVVGTIRVEMVQPQPTPTESLPAPEAGHEPEELEDALSDAVDALGEEIEATQLVDEGLANTESMGGLENEVGAPSTEQPPEHPSAPPAQPAPIVLPIQMPAPLPQPIPRGPKEKEKPAELFSYLENLTRYLPVEQRSIYDGSDMHMRLETLKGRLRGVPGLHRQLPRSIPPVGAETEEKISQSRIRDTFSFMGKLSQFHPDKDIGLALKYKIAHILGKLRKP
jgi:hypothetical protein